MTGLKQILDPARMGDAARQLEEGLHRRIVGTLRLARPAQGDVPAWSIDVSFSAPVYRSR